ncbi:MAG: Fic family protein [Acidimicrobiales bacterium]
MIRPTVALVVGINASVRQDDEWFDEPDELGRIQRIVDDLAEVEDPVRAAGLVAYRIAKSQAFSEGNKRTAVLTARWILDENQVDGQRFIRESDFDLANLLLRAARGEDVGDQILNLFESRR